MKDGMSVGTSKRVTLIIAAVTAAVSTFMMSAVQIALPTIGKEFAMEAVLLGWVVTAMTLPQAAILLAAGRLADIYGRKKIFLYGMVLFTIASFLCAIASSAVWLVSCRVLQGIAAGMVFGTQMAIVTSVFPGEERGRALGISVAAAFLGLSAGPFLGGVLTQHLGWRSIFYINAFLCLLVVGLIFWRLKGEWAEARGDKFDIAGAMVFGISLVVLLYGFTVVITTPGIVLVLLGILGITLFVWLESRTDSPFFNLSLFRKNTVFVFSNVATLIQYCATFSSIVLLSLYLQYTKGFSPQAAGLILIVTPVIMTIFAPIAGRLSDRIDPRLVASVGMALSCVTLIFFVFLTGETTLRYIIPTLAVFGLGMAFFSSPNSNAIMGSVERKSLGVASGTQGVMRACGQMLGMGIVMILFSIYIGDVEITPEYYPAFMTSMRLALIIFAALCFCGIFAQLAGKKARQS